MNKEELFNKKETGWKNISEESKEKIFKGSSTFCRKNAKRKWILQYLRKRNLNTRR